MGMDMTTGNIRELTDDDHNDRAEAFAKLTEQLKPNEVGVFGQSAQIEKLQRLVHAGNTKDPDKD